MSSDRVDALTAEAEVFYRRLMSVADDYGRFDGDWRVLRASLYPKKTDTVSEADIELWLGECTALIDGETEPLIVAYVIGGKRIVRITNFGQRIRSDSRYPAETEEARTNASKCAQMLAYSTRASNSNTNTNTNTNTHSVETTAEETDYVPAAARASSPEVQPPKPEAPNGNGAAAAQEPSSKLVPVPRHFEAWWDGWSSVRGTNHKPAAAEAYRHVVTADSEEALFRCTASYLGSLENPAKGYNPENFLLDQAKAAFSARWPTARGSPADERKRKALEDFRRRTVADLEEGNVNPGFNYRKRSG